MRAQSLNFLLIALCCFNVMASQHCENTVAELLYEKRDPEGAYLKFLDCADRSDSEHLFGLAVLYLQATVYVPELKTQENDAQLVEFLEESSILGNERALNIMIGLSENENFTNVKFDQSLITCLKKNKNGQSACAVKQN